MVGLLRHRQTKGPDSARPYLNRRATPRLHLKCPAQGQMSVVGMFRQPTLLVPVQAKVVTSYRHAEVYFL
jgi:hypothetical protein